MNKTKYMCGNWVKDDEGTIFQVVGVNSIEADVRPRDWFAAFRRKFSTLKGIPLDDDFFVRNGYTIDEPCKDGYERYVQHIVASDGIGPAVTKYTAEFGRLWSGDEVEYCVTGIIIRTIDEFQNIMNICGCEDIADKVKP